MRWPAYIVYPFLRPFITRIRGMEHVPHKGACIIAANHASYIDGPLLTAAVFWHTGRWTRFVVARDQLGGPVRKWFLMRTGMVAQGRAVSTMLHLLQKGECVGIFPEGGRTDNGEIIHTEFTGAGVLAHLSGAPVVPIGIDGTFLFWSRYRKRPTLKRCISITTAKPLRFAKKKTVPKQLARHTVTAIMRAIGKILGQKYPMKPRNGPLPWER